MRAPAYCRGGQLACRCARRRRPGHLCRGLQPARDQRGCVGRHSGSRSWPGLRRGRGARDLTQAHLESNCLSVALPQLRGTMTIIAVIEARRGGVIRKILRHRSVARSATTRLAPENPSIPRRTANTACRWRHHLRGRPRLPRKCPPRGVPAARTALEGLTQTLHGGFRP